MKIFILEDNLERRNWFDAYLKGHTVTHADSCAQVNRFHPPYDVIFLDHDLGGRRFYSLEDNGETFAKMIAHHVGEATVILHSFNPVGAQNIERALLDVRLDRTDFTGPILIAPFLGREFKNLIYHIKKGRNR